MDTDNSSSTPESTERPIARNRVVRTRAEEGNLQMSGESYDSNGGGAGATRRSKVDKRSGYGKWNGRNRGLARLKARLVRKTTTERGKDADAAELESLYGPNYRAFASFLDRWWGMSLNELVSFKTAVDLGIEPIDPKAKDFWARLDELEEQHFAMSGECDDEEETFEDALEAFRAMQILGDSEEILARSIRKEALRAVHGAGRVEQLDSALTAIFISLAPDFTLSLFSPDDDRYKMKYETRMGLIDCVVNAALALATWDLASTDSPYTPEVRDLLYEPWREVVDRFDRG